MTMTREEIIKNLKISYLDYITTLKNQDLEMTGNALQMRFMQETKPEL